jgi:hypothetical protein
MNSERQRKGKVAEVTEKGKNVGHGKNREQVRFETRERERARKLVDVWPMEKSTRLKVRRRSREGEQDGGQSRGAKVAIADNDWRLANGNDTV